MGMLSGIILGVIVVYGIPKCIEISKRNAMCNEMNYRAANGIETDYNKVIELQAKLCTKQITKNQYYDLIASGYDRKEAK